MTCRRYSSWAERHLRNDSAIGSSLRVYGMDKIKALRPKVKNTMDLALVKEGSYKGDLVSRVSFVDVVDKGLNT